MKLVASLVSLGRSFSGRGTNHEGEDFVGRLELQPLLDGKALMLTYTATRVDGVHLHSEVTLLATDGKGRPCLWPVMEELPVVLPHPEVSNVKLHDGTQAIVFASGSRSRSGPMASCGMRTAGHCPAVTSTPGRAASSARLRIDHGACGPRLIV